MNGYEQRAANVPAGRGGTGLSKGCEMERDRTHWRRNGASTDMAGKPGACTHLATNLSGCHRMISTRSLALTPEGPSAPNSST